MFTAVAVLGGLAAITGIGLTLAARRLPDTGDDPVERINALLPQTQCAQCGFPGCRPYAQAILDGRADIDQCAPGGDATVTALANLLGQPSRPVNRAFGEPQPPSVAVIDEDACIGCALCLPACPVDAIVGAARFTHTVLRQECTGCELCLPPCPVDCIRMEALDPRRERAA